MNVMMKDQLLVLFEPGLAFKLVTRQNFYAKCGFDYMEILFSFPYICSAFAKI